MSRTLSLWPLCSAEVLFLSTAENRQWEHITTENTVTPRLDAMPRMIVGRTVLPHVAVPQRCDSGHAAAQQSTESGKTRGGRQLAVAVGGNNTACTDRERQRNDRRFHVRHRQQKTRQQPWQWRCLVSRMWSWCGERWLL